MPDKNYLKTLSTGANTYDVFTPEDLPETFPPAEHNHDDRYYTEMEMDVKLLGKSDTDHTHDDRYYTESETNTLLNGKSDTDHTHDDRYYTETETNTLLAAKADLVHTHGAISSDGKITDPDVTVANGDKLLIADASGSNAVKRVSSAFDGSTVTKALTQKGTFESFSQPGHTHDDRYYTETEMNTKLDDIDVAIAGKAPAIHIHDDRYYTETEMDAALALKANAADLGTMAAVDDAASDGKTYGRKNGEWHELDTSLVEWGEIGGDLADQTDLQTALDDKLDAEIAELTGDIVTFEAETEHAIKNVTVAIAPVQDLHGYDNPWPSGGGKNKFNVADISWNSGILDDNGQPATSTQSHYTANYTPVEATTAYTLSGMITEPNVQSRIYFYDSSKNWISRTNGFSGTSYTFTTPSGCAFIQVQCALAITAPTNWQLELGSTVTTFAPYFNICPISGWTEVHLSRTGANIWGSLAIAQGVTASMSTARIYPDEKYVQFGAGGGIRVPYFTDKVKFKDNTQYTFMLSFVNNTSAYAESNMRVRYTDGTYTNVPNLATAGTKETKVIVTPSGKTVEGLCKVNARGTTNLYYDESGIFEGVHTVDEFTPYSGTTLPISWQTEAGTVYGGELNVTSGVLTVTHKKYVFDSNLTSDDINVTNNGSRAQVSRLAYISEGIGYAHFVSDAFKTIRHNMTLHEYEVQPSSVARMFLGLPASVTSVQDAIDWFTTTPVEVVGELATPLTYQLTPNQVSTLLGTNHLWSDTGSTTLELRKPTGDLAYQDTVDYDTQVINKPDLTLKADADTITYTETTMKATRNYIAGDLICVSGGDLYRATTNISNNANLTVGTNIIATTIDAELKLRAKSADVDASLDLKADKNGSYSDLTAGNAEQLVSTVFIKDNIPYNFRTAGGSADIGDRLYEQIIGGTVAWNQIIPTEQKSGTKSFDASATYYFNFHSNLNIPVVSNHVMLMRLKITRNIANNNALGIYFICNVNGTGTNLPILYINNGEEDGYIYIIMTTPTGAEKITTIRCSNYNGKRGFSAGDSVSYDDLVLFDLTQMFGSTIADYIYNLEQTEAGAGVTWFKKFFPKDYYSYNTGELLSVNTSAHKTVGFNLWNGSNGTTGTNYRYWDISIGETNNLQLELIEKDPSVDLTGIYIGFCYDGVVSSAPSGYRWVLNNGVVQNDHSNICLYGTNAGKLGRYLTIYPKTDAAYVNLLKKYDICVHLTWDGERDGDYEPYEEHVYPLDSELELRGIPKLDANNNLYYDGDIYDPDGTVTRKYGIVDLGTLTWTKNAQNSRFFTSNLENVIKAPTDSWGADIICSAYKSIIWNSLDDKFITVALSNNKGRVYIKDTSYDDADATTFKSAMSGVYLVYELAESTTESADPYQSPQVVNDWGTEEYTDAREVQMPVGHESKYTNNLRAKLEMAPESPDGNGDYIVRQTSGINEYVPFADIAYSKSNTYNKTEIDTALSAIEEMISGKESSMVATKNYTAGSLIITNDILYKATSNIASGSALVVGSNVVATTVEAEIALKANESEMSTKADIDGSYPDLTAGNAGQLVSTVGIEENSPYLFRTTGGSVDVGDRLILKEVTGGTVAWNQTVSDIDNVQNWLYDTTRSSLTISNGIGTFVKFAGIGDGVGYVQPRYNNSVFLGNHKYLVTIDLKSVTGTKVTLFSNSYQVGAMDYIFTNTDTWNTVTKMFIGSDTYLPGVRRSIWIRYNNDNDVTVQFKNFMLFDLTQMFGSTIADYIYSLQQAEAGAGVAWFRKMFPKDYYQYNAGELLSVNASAHKMVGFNLLKTFYGWSQSSSIAFNADYAFRVIKGAKYEYCFDDVKNATSWRSEFLCYDLNGKRVFDDVLGTVTGMYHDSAGYYVNSSNGILKSADFTSNYDGYVMPVLCLGDTTSSSVVVNPCAHLVWDGERNGEYEPYEEHSYPLDSDLELRGVPKLDTNNNLYYDGDIYNPDGTVTRKYGIVDLGTLGWNYASNNKYFWAVINNIAIAENYNSTINMVCPIYRNTYANEVFSITLTDNDKTMAGHISSNHYFWVKNLAYSDTVTFKTAMSGVYLVYELAEPTTESADPYQETQICDDFGTEEFIVTEHSGVALPVGNTAIYQPNLRAKLEMAPNSPEDDGDYIVRQNSGINEYVAIGDNPTISGLTSRCPACPTDTNGTYVLKATVSGNTVTYAWVAA